MFSNDVEVRIKVIGTWSHHPVHRRGAGGGERGDGAWTDNMACSNDVHVCTWVPSACPPHVGYRGRRCSRGDEASGNGVDVRVTCVCCRFEPLTLMLMLMLRCPSPFPRPLPDQWPQLVMPQLPHLYDQAPTVKQQSPLLTSLPHPQPPDPPT